MTHRLRSWLVLGSIALLWGCNQAETHVSWSWYAGDLHVHSSGASNDTDGLSWPVDIATMARERGLSWLVLTDHSNSTGSMHCDDIEDCPNLGPEFPWLQEVDELSDSSFVMMDGTEISPVARSPGMGQPRGHVGCLPPEGGFTFDGAFIDRPDGEVSGASAVSQCGEAGGWAIVNHPFPGIPWISFDWTTTTGFQGMEVWNGGLRWDQGDVRALWSWECMVASGHSIVPVAGSDNHQTGLALPGTELAPPLGQPRTSVALEEGVSLQWPAILSALSAGRVVLHEDGTFISALPDNASGNWLLRGTSPLASRLELRRIPMGADCDPSDPAFALHEVVFATDVVGSFEELSSVSIEETNSSEGPTYAAITRDDLAASMEGDLAMTGLLESLRAADRSTP